MYIQKYIYIYIYFTHTHLNTHIRTHPPLHTRTHSLEHTPLHKRTPGQLFVVNTRSMNSSGVKIVMRSLRNSSLPVSVLRMLQRLKQRPPRLLPMLLQQIMPTRLPPPVLLLVLLLMGALLRTTEHRHRRRLRLETDPPELPVHHHVRPESPPHSRSLH